MSNCITLNKTLFQLSWAPNEQVAPSYCLYEAKLEQFSFSARLFKKIQKLETQKEQPKKYLRNQK